MQATVYPNTAAPARERSFVTVALVGALHIAAIYTILVALDIVPPPLPNAPVTFHYIAPTQPKTAPQPPPTNPVVLTRPSDPTMPPKPDFQIGSDEGPGGITNTPGGDTFVAASALTGTHSTPDYPAVDRRLDHQGTVRLALSIDAQGIVSGATVEQSSGYDGLDAAAIAWVKAHWRYKPAMRNGAAVPMTTQASVVFRLTQTGG